MNTGILLEIQRFSLHDGPGIRTTVFFKGCNMRCAWCHNPESFQMRPQLAITYPKCVHCGACAKICPTGAHGMAEGKHVFLPEKCALCKACIDVCPAGALTQVGREYPVPEVMAVIKRDRPFYEKSGGGVTFSGGEAALQPEFLTALAAACKEQGFHTCLETNGMIAPNTLSSIMDFVDLFLVDFKLQDAGLLKKYTGTAGDTLYGTLQRLAECRKPVVLRCPVIPGINDTDAFFDAILAIKKRYPNIQKAEIMPYHDMGAGKWQAIGLGYTLADIKNPSPDLVAKWRARISDANSKY